MNVDRELEILLETIKQVEHNCTAEDLPQLIALHMAVLYGYDDTNDAIDIIKAIYGGEYYDS